MSSKYRNKQRRKAKQEKKMEVVFKDEWAAMFFLVDFGVQSEYSDAVYIPHDHLPRDALKAIDYLVALGYVPKAASEIPDNAALTSEYLKDGRTTLDRPEVKEDEDV